jgi:methylated-DNA-[protein]-cysteine S-methyltransferase
VKSDGTVGGYAYGSEIKKYMLSEEGLKINDNKILNFQKHLFHFKDF